MLKAKEIQELVDVGILSDELRHQILEYYNQQKKPSSNRLFIAFGILGAILAGLGIILIIAHNWDDLSRPIKTGFAFLPLLLGQIFCVYAIRKKGNARAWKEGASAFLIFAFGASISLVSQIYNIPGDFGSFLLTWILVIIPLIYIMSSSIASLLVICGITVYAMDQSGTAYNAYRYWIFLLLLLPHYYLLFKYNPNGNFLNFHHWFIPVSLSIALSSISGSHEEFMFIAYMSLFGIFILIGGYLWQRNHRFADSGYVLIGSLGTLVMLLMLGYAALWEDIRRDLPAMSKLITLPEILGSVVLTGLATGLFYFLRNAERPAIIGVLRPVFLLFIPVFIIGLFFPVATLLINLMVLGLGLLIIRIGYRTDHLGYLNIGLMIVVALALCRFFDTGISFVLRGIFFLAAGIGFFLLNFRMLKNRKANAE